MGNLVNLDKMGKMENLDQLVFREWPGNRELQVTMGRWVCKDRKVLQVKLEVRDLGVTLVKRGFLDPMDCRDPLVHLASEERLVLQDHEVSKACLVALGRTE